MSADQRPRKREHGKHVVAASINGNAVVLPDDLGYLIREPPEGFAYCGAAELWHQPAQVVAVGEE